MPDFHRIILLLSLPVLFAGCVEERAATSTEERPNIVLIVADDLGYGDLGVYGQTQFDTPHLDRLAEEGLRFTQFYAGSTVCAPARAVLMTGIHTGRNHIRGNREIQPMGQEPLPTSVPTVAEMLQRAGYRTALIGKWGLGGPDSGSTPNSRGFDHFFGYLCQRHAHNYYPEFLFRNEERISIDGNRLPEPKRPDGAGLAVEKSQYSHDLLTSDALRWIRENRADPFFLYLAYTIPHANNEAGDAGMEVPDYGPYADRDWPEPAKGFAAMVGRLDRDVGRLTELLRELGIERNTLVIFTSDNGPHAEGGHDPHFFNSNGPLRGIKRDLYEGGIRVPTIAWWPGTIEPGGVTDHVGYFGDVMATFAELAGVAAPGDLDSVSMVPVLTGDGDLRQHDYLYWEFHGRGASQAVRMGDWKAVRIPLFDGPIELYDLASDIGERRDVADEHPEIVARMEEIMSAAHHPSELWASPE